MIHSKTQKLLQIGKQKSDRLAKLEKINVMGFEVEWPNKCKELLFCLSFIVLGI